MSTTIDTTALTAIPHVVGGRRVAGHGRREHALQLDAGVRVGVVGDPAHRRVAQPGIQRRPHARATRSRSSAPIRAAAAAPASSTS